MAGMEGFTKLPSYSKGQVSSERLGELQTYASGIRYKGLFDLDELYRIIFNWLVSKGFEVHEHKYKSIVLPAEGRERSFDWNAYKKGNEFVMVWIFIHFQIQDVYKIEVVQNGEKKTLTKGRVFIRVAYDIEMDFSERYAYSKFHKTILNFIVNFMWAKKVETYWEDKTRFKTYELINHIKETLEFMTKGNEHYDVW